VPPVAVAALADAAALLERSDVLVHATALGRAAADPLPVALEAAPAGLVVLDAVYAPGATPLVRAARARGLRAADGHALLLYQGAAAFALWTGRQAPLEPMRRALAD
jgi:shikimate dehydrogenase